MKQRSRLNALLESGTADLEARQIERNVIDAADKCRHLIDELLDYWSLPMHTEPPF